MARTSSPTFRDKEVQLYASLIERPTEFKDGFGWSTVAGIIFCGLIMLPGSIYLGMMSGGNLGRAANWVTLILFNEIARRSLKKLNKQNLVVLLHAAGVVMAANVLFPGGPFARLVWRAYLAGSNAIRDAGMRDAIPSWWAPSADSAAITERNLLHPDWIVPILLMIFIIAMGVIKRYTLGYFFFRITSDVEHLPFPMAPVAAQGAMALAEADEDQATGDLASQSGQGDKDKPKDDPGKFFFSKAGRKTPRTKSQRWRLFSLGAVLGLAFGFIQIGVPALTGVFFGQRFYLLPQPFVDTTTLTEGFLPATPTGVAIDMGIILLGMVLPFWAVMGTGFAILLTILLNPILYQAGVLTRWQPGMDTVNTTFLNGMDFWMSFGFGASLGLMAVSVFQSIRAVMRSSREFRERKHETAAQASRDVWATPAGRGDFSLKLSLGIYILCSLAVVGVTYLLLSGGVMGRAENRGAMVSVMIFMLIFVFIYNPLISYLNARLLGIAGQTIDIPHVKEAAFILSGAKGIDVWMAPIPIENYGHQAQSFRVSELTGTNFRSLIKTDLVATPALFLFSFIFWAFIWSANEIPGGSNFPYAQVYWEFQSKNTALFWSATHVQQGQEVVSFWETQLGQSIHPEVLGAGFGSTVGLFALMSVFGLPVMFVYGMIKGLGQFPHLMVLEVAGALIARYYFRKKYGPQQFLRMAPTILAGYFTGVGLIGMATVALDLIKNAVSSAPM